MKTEIRDAGKVRVGDRVRIKTFSGPAAKVIEYRGPLGPGGEEVYRVAVPQGRKFSYFELLRNQLDVLSTFRRRPVPARMRTARKAMLPVPKRRPSSRARHDD